MKTCKKLSIEIIRKIVFISIILIGLLTAGVFAARSNLNTVTITCADDSEITIVTSEANVGKILEDNYIILLDDEVVTPSVDSNIDYSKKITISKVTDEPVIVAEEVSDISKEEILGNYSSIVEKIETIQEEIPYETVTKDISASGTETQDKVVQEGENGLKETKYKVKYQNEVEIERVMISETVVKEPVDKIVQISTKIASRSGGNRAISSEAIAASVADITPQVVTMNCSAYSADENGAAFELTSSGKVAAVWHTLAAGKSVPIGTVVYIPYFANEPNGGWFVVEDRGGAITDQRLDVFMSNVSQCNSFGRRNLECYVYYK